MSTILQSVHIVSVSLEKKQKIKNVIYYFNNFIDWNSYNSIYEEDFLNKDTKIALYYSHKK